MLFRSLSLKYLIVMAKGTNMKKLSVLALTIAFCMCANETVVGIETDSFKLST
jgi:hypothetical protein